MRRRLNVNIPWFQREHYEAINELLAEERMLGTFDEWLKATTIHVGDLKARGVTVRTVLIDPQEYAAYCSNSGLKPNRANLGAFAIALARRDG